MPKKGRKNDINASHIDDKANLCAPFFQFRTAPQLGHLKDSRFPNRVEKS